MFSVIVPVRNMEQTICRTLDSIIRQSYPCVEIVVVEGQSTDRTYERVQPYRNQLAVLISEPDAGLYDAINKGLAASSGQIIAILNGDDYYSNDQVLQRYSEKFENPNIGIVFGDLEFFPATSPARTIRTYSSRHFRPDKLAYGWMPPHPTTFVRRCVYDKVGHYRPEYRISSDFEFLVRALWLHAVQFDRVDEVVVRMQYGGLSTKGLKATYILNKEILQACRSNGLRTNWLNILSKFPAKLREFLPALRPRP